MAVYMRRWPFIFYNSIYIRNYIFTANPANTIPGRYTFSKELLIVCYEKTIQKVIP